MKNLVIINAVLNTEFAYKSLFNNESAFKQVLIFARHLPEAAHFVILAKEKLEQVSSDFEVIANPIWNAKMIIEKINELAKGFDHIFYFFGDCPFLDLSLAERLYKTHCQYFADYTFADGYPYGLTVEILKANLGEALLVLLKENDTVDRQLIFELIKRDINSFDLETEIAETDLRALRLSFTADQKRNFLLLERLKDAGAKDARSACELVQKKPELLRTLPAYFPIQIVDGCLQSCSYCPYPLIEPNLLKVKNYLPKEKFYKLIDLISDFCKDGVISLSLWGEPALHPEIYEFISFVLNESGLELVIETSGLGWEREKLEKVKNNLKRNPAFIISLDSPEQSLYEKLRGSGFEEAVQTAKFMLNLFPHSTYLQAVRMQENEEALERFYREWKTQTENIIIQKYDFFSGFLPERKVTDLSPLKRLPCWHLKRDFPILLDGSVLLCREDLQKKYILGNVFVDSLLAIWQRGEVFYQRQLKGDYEELCRICDEYYTYNF